jgi:hypothetical protein
MTDDKPRSNVLPFRPRSVRPEIEVESRFGAVVYEGPRTWRRGDELEGLSGTMLDGPDTEAKYGPEPPEPPTPGSPETKAPCTWEHWPPPEEKGPARP